MQTEDVAALLFETDAGATGSVLVSQVSAGRKNRLWLEISADAETFAFDQERAGHAGGAAARRAPKRSRATSTRSAPAAAALRDPARRPPAGLPGLLRRLRRARATPPSPGRRRPDGLPRLADGAARGPDHRGGAGVGAARRVGRGGADEARAAHRLPARVAAGADRRRGPARTATRRSSWPPGPRSATGPSPPPTSPPTVSTPPRPTASAPRSSANGLELSALAYYDNNLHPDPDEREAIHAHLRACIDAAAELGGVPVGTFIGRDPGAHGQRKPARRPSGRCRRWSTTPASAG